MARKMDVDDEIKHLTMRLKAEVEFARLKDRLKLHQSSTRQWASEIDNEFTRIFGSASDDQGSNNGQSPRSSHSTLNCSLSRATANLAVSVPLLESMPLHRNSSFRPADHGEYSDSKQPEAETPHQDKLAPVIIPPSPARLSRAGTDESVQLDSVARHVCLSTWEPFPNYFDCTVAEKKHVSTNCSPEIFSRCTRRQHLGYNVDMLDFVRSPPRPLSFRVESACDSDAEQWI